MGPSLPFPCGEVFSLFTTIAELQKGRRHLAGDIDSNKSILQKGDLINMYNTCIKLQQVPINIVIIPNNNFSLFSGPPHRAKTTPLSVPYTFLTHSWHGTSTAIMVFGPGKKKLRPVRIMYSVAFQANSPVMEFCLIVFNLKISLTRAQTQLWYFCVLSQFCSAESWLEPDRSNVFQKALRTIFSRRFKVFVYIWLL